MLRCRGRAKLPWLWAGRRPVWTLVEIFLRFRGRFDLLRPNGLLSRDRRAGAVPRFPAEEARRESVCSYEAALPV
jgi:hypothetical protein